MKTTTFFILFAGVLISLDYGALGARWWNGNEVKSRVVNEKDEVKPPVQNLPLLTLPSLSSFSLPALSFPQIPYLQGLSNRLPPSGPVKVTKTEFMEVTRRLTVHPVCYTAYEAKSPCLPFSHLDFQDDDYENGDFDSVRETHENFDLNEVRKSIQVTPTSLVTATREPASVKEEVEEEEYEGGDRSGRYLQFKLRRENDQSGGDSSSKIEGSEFIPITIRHPNQQQTTEYFTKTVLVTKLEKYTDRRVTATLMAINCLPVDRNIPMCQTQYPSPIKETPDDLFTDEKSQHHPEQVSQVSSPTQYTKQSRENENQQIDAMVQAVYGAARRAGAQYPEPVFVSPERDDSKINSDRDTVDENTETVF